MPSKTQSILLGGVAMGIAATIVSIVPWAGACFCCLAIAGAGLMSVWHYTNTYDLTIPGGQGAGMGALAGVVAAVVSSLIGLILQATGLTPGFREGIRQGIASGQLDQETADMILGYVESPLFVAGVLLMTVIIGAVLGAVGGVIGASLFKKGGAEPGAPDTPPPPPYEGRDVSRG